MKSSLAVFLAALAVSGAALAQETAPAQEASPELPAFDEVDRNDDGMIDRTEAAVVEGLDFTVADANQDGRISEQEYEQLS